MSVSSIQSVLPNYREPPYWPIATASTALSKPPSTESLEARNQVSPGTYAPSFNSLRHLVTRLGVVATRLIQQPSSPMAQGPVNNAQRQAPAVAEVPSFYLPDNAQNAVEQIADIFSAFYQGPTGNCVTVAAIKAAMARFGHSPHQVFQKVTRLDDGFEVVMRDNYPLKITDEELEEAKYGAGFETTKPGNAVFTSAIFLFAVSAKRAQLENNDDIAKRSFETAMATLNDGEFAGEGLLRLGLKGHMVRTNIKELMRGAIGTIANNGHDLAVMGGYLDVYGNKKRLMRDMHWKAGIKLV